MEPVKIECDYSTLPEIDTRTETHLEVDFRKVETTLEARFSYPGLEPARHSVLPLAAAPSERPWWKRFRVLLVVIAVVVVVAVVGTVLGLLLTSRTASGAGDANGERASATSSPSESPLSNTSPASTPTSSLASTVSSGTSTTLSQTTPTSRPTSRSTTLSTVTLPPSRASPTSVVLLVSTTTSSSLVPTRTPSASETPKSHIRIGNAEGQNFKSTVGFLENGSSASACSYTVILEVDGGNPCGMPFLLSDGFEYVWNGCGGPTWATWRNPGSGSAKFEYLDACASDVQTWKCGNTTVRSNWLCGEKLSA